jgi:hypothetical protein
MDLAWGQPWFAPWREPGAEVAARLAAGAPLHEALNAAGPAPVRFVQQGELPAGTAYEQFVFETRLCPVRPGLHDFFNGLVWLRFPQAKAALNRLQAQEIARTGIAGRRGPVRDAITVFDENGALLAAPERPHRPCLARRCCSRFRSGRGRLAGRAMQRRGAGRQAFHAAAGARHPRLVPGKRELFLL